MRPHIAQPNAVDGPSTSAIPPPTPSGVGTSGQQNAFQPRLGHKGKEKEVDHGMPSTPGGNVVGGGGAGGADDDDEEGGKGGKKKNNYKHLIKGIPGMYGFWFHISACCALPPFTTRAECAGHD